MPASVNITITPWPSYETEHTAKSSTVFERTPKSDIITSFVG